MAATVEHYSDLVEETALEGTVVVVRGATIEEVADALDVGPAWQLPADADGTERLDESTHAAYTFVEVDGGVLGMEDTGYADPPNAALVALSSGGRSAAVVRDNAQGRTRFACARDGVLLFDADEYIFVEDRSAVPDELRDLFDRAWVDLGAEDVGEGEDAVAVALAMAEVVTGVEVTAEDVHRAGERGVPRHLVPTLRYAEDQDVDLA